MSSIEDRSIQTCRVHGKCYAKYCLYDTLADCQKNAGRSVCNKDGKTGCYYTATMCGANIIASQYYPYMDNNLVDCPYIRSMGSAKINGTTYYRISQLTTGFSYDNDILTCDTTICNCSNISTKSTAGTVRNRYCYSKGGASIEYSDILQLYQKNVGSSICPPSCLLCNESKGYYETLEECETRYGSGKCEKFYSGTVNHYCYRSFNGCEFNTYTALTCTKPHQVKIATTESNNSGVSCGKCVCESGYDDLETCNNWLACLADVFKNMYDGKSCATLGYKLEKTQVNQYAQDKYECTACPFDGNKWRCEAKF